MRTSFHRALQQVLHHEGGWSDHPRDPGGATMKGITIRTYSEWLGRAATKEELRAIPDAHVEAIYRRGYWDAVRGDDLPGGIDLMVFDFAVNAGRRRAIVTLQQAVNMPTASHDGAIGPRTLAAVKDLTDRIGVPAVATSYATLREVFYRGLPTFETFGKGWLRRNEAVLAMARTWPANDDDSPGSGKAYKA